MVLTCFADPAVHPRLDTHPPHEIADALARLDGVVAGVPFRLLDKDRALLVFEELAPVDQQVILLGLRDQAFRDLVALHPGFAGP